MNPAFDDWLDNKLHSMFNAVVSEPLPPELLKLLDAPEEEMPNDGGKKGAK